MNVLPLIYRPTKAISLCAVALFVGGQTCSLALAQSSAQPFKFTTGLYQLHGGAEQGLGLDANLRYSAEMGNAWLGWFRSPLLEVAQTRGGWDRSFAMGPVRLLPSLQTATGGFWSPDKAGLRALVWAAPIFATTPI
jgi:hypothetical protein